jgi:hypothetical protein
LRQLVSQLKSCEIIDIKIQDTGYDYSLFRIVPGRYGKILRSLQKTLCLIQRLRRAVLFRLRINAPRLDQVLENIEQALGKPIDQTNGDALAQIQAVLRKRAE